MEKKQRMQDLLRRLLNQNEQALGLFYLHQDHEAGVFENSVAFLRVTIAYKRENYEILKDARKGRLDPNF